MIMILLRLNRFEAGIVCFMVLDKLINFAYTHLIVLFERFSRSKKIKYICFFARLIVPLQSQTLKQMDSNDFKLRKSQVVSFFVIALGLYYLTGSYLMMAGIFLLLILGVHLLGHWLENRNKKE